MKKEVVVVEEINLLKAILEYLNSNFRPGTGGYLFAFYALNRALAENSLDVANGKLVIRQSYREVFPFMTRKDYERIRNTAGIYYMASEKMIILPGSFKQPRKSVHLSFVKVPAALPYYIQKLGKMDVAVDITCALFYNKISKYEIEETTSNLYAQLFNHMQLDSFIRNYVEYALDVILPMLDWKIYVCTGREVISREPLKSISQAPSTNKQKLAIASLVLYSGLLRPDGIIFKPANDKSAIFVDRLFWRIFYSDLLPADLAELGFKVIPPTFLKDAYVKADIKACPERHRFKQINPALLIECKSSLRKFIKEVKHYDLLC
jgi:hypothetical protein